MSSDLTTERQKLVETIASKPSVETVEVKAEIQEIKETPKKKVLELPKAFEVSVAHYAEFKGRKEAINLLRSIYKIGAGDVDSVLLSAIAQSDKVSALEDFHNMRTCGQNTTEIKKKARSYL